MRPRKNSGFTLMEVLLVTVLVALTGVAIFGTFSNGLKLWAKSVDLNHQGDTAIGLDKFGEDLRSALPFSGIAFKGSATHLSMAAVVRAPADRQGSRSSEGIIDQLGGVKYSFDPAEGKLLRRQANYAQAVKGQWGTPQEIMSGVEEVVFHYYFSSDKGPLSKDEADGKVPSGVMVEIKRKADGAGSRLKRFFNIPAGE